jgi:ABC-2 type transport system permease protein
MFVYRTNRYFTKSLKENKFKNGCLRIKIAISCDRKTKTYLFRSFHFIYMNFSDICLPSHFIRFMEKILLIIQREYLTRVRKKSFIVMTILGPLLMAALIILPVYLAQKTSSSVKVAVLDETGWFYQKFHSQDNMQFYYVDKDVEQAKSEALVKGDMLLYIPLPKLNLPENAELFSIKQPGLNVRNYIKSVMKQVVEDKKLLAKGIDPNVLKSVKAHINLVTIKVSDQGAEKQSNTNVEVGLAIFSGILIYMFVFMYGAQVLRGVMEEKQNRIVEVIISSVKPFQLMMGKIIGVGLVGLTQFLLWIVLTLALVGVFQAGAFGGISAHGIQALTEQTAGPSGAIAGSHSGELVTQISGMLSSIDFKVMILSFIFYFLAGYMLYSSLFAAVGGAIDHDADAQQFMLPISIPLIFSVAMTSVVANQPDGALALWLSMIPFTSPVIMMMRIPFGVPYWQIGLSAGLLLLTFVFTTFLAGKIYRIGILIYGKKVTYSDLWKWIRY